MLVAYYILAEDSFENITRFNLEIFIIGRKCVGCIFFSL